MYSKLPWCKLKNLSPFSHHCARHEWLSKKCAEMCVCERGGDFRLFWRGSVSGWMGSHFVELAKICRSIDHKTGRLQMLQLSGCLNLRLFASKTYWKGEEWQKSIDFQDHWFPPIFRNDSKIPLQCSTLGNNWLKSDIYF